MKSLHRIRGNATVIVLAVLAGFVLLGGIGGCMWGWPTYRVYEQRKAGEAMLAHAQASNKIIGASLKENEAYLRYLWINGRESNNPTVIYVPTEAGLPILEAGRRPSNSTK